MILAEDLQKHALEIFGNIDPTDPKEVDLRRVLSACYYALFHQINRDAAALLAPNVSTAINHRVQRWFDHGEMKKVCGRFVKQTLEQPLLDLVGISASLEMQSVCRTFIRLQEARHSADYDLSFAPGYSQTREYLKSMLVARKTWARIAATAEANVFILSLLLWKNWDRERP